jgi:hypothetical protein
MKIHLCASFYPSFGADLLIAFLGGVLTLLAGYMVYLVSVRQTREDRLKYVVSLIGSIVPSAIRQAGYCTTYGNCLKQDPFTDEYLQLEANADPKRLADKVDQEGVYHAFLWKYGREATTYKNFRDLYSQIDYIDYIILDLIKTNERILEFTWQRKKQYALIFKQALDKLRAITISELRQQQPEFISFSESLLDTYSANEASGENLVESHENVVKPLHQFIVQNVNQHDKVTELIFLVLDLLNQYHGIELAGKHNAKDYYYYAKALEDTANRLRTYSAQLRSDFTIDSKP